MKRVTITRRGRSAARASTTSSSRGARSRRARPGLVAPEPRPGAPLPLFGAGSGDDARIATRFAGGPAPRRRAASVPRARPRPLAASVPAARVERVLDDPRAGAAIHPLAGALLCARTLSGDAAARTAGDRRAARGRRDGR